MALLLCINQWLVNGFSQPRDCFLSLSIHIQGIVLVLGVSGSFAYLGSGVQPILRLIIAIISVCLLHFGDSRLLLCFSNEADAILLSRFLLLSSLF